ncbi:hypothetical protein GVH94_02855 [Escherichia coli]|nr:hypothetical protein [Escherichia coli]MBE9837139.1 hypothetical protein [Escherichia coli]
MFALRKISVSIFDRVINGGALREIRDFSERFTGEGVGLGNGNYCTLGAFFNRY